jgi:hypothetical protein
MVVVWMLATQVDMCSCAPFSASGHSWRNGTSPRHAPFKTDLFEAGSAFTAAL